MISASKLRLLAAVLLAACVATASPAFADTYAQRVFSNLNPSLAVGFTTRPGDSTRGYVIEQRSGRIRVVDLTTNTLLPTGDSLMQVTGITTDHGEQGFLGMTFDPAFATNGHFYVAYSAGASGSYETRIERYTVTGDPLTATTANPATVHTIMRIAKPYAQHNGGWLEFGPNDGYLYISTGDGGYCSTCTATDSGPGRDPVLGNGQDKNTLLGKMLRVDVHADDFTSDALRNYAVPDDNPFVDAEGLDEIWAYGLRNPWRNGFDRETGDLWIADVGANAREEVNLQRAGWPGTANYGWRLREGDVATGGGVGGPPPADHVPPVYAYRHIGSSADPNFTGNAVTGGYVYRGSVDEFIGHYIFADFVSRHIWKLDPDAIDIPSSVTRINGQLTPDSGTLSGLSSFGQDSNGDLYLVQLSSGPVFRVATTSQKAFWNGNSAAAGTPGNGVGWSDANNWTRGLTADAALVARDTAVFVAGSSLTTVDLESNQTVSAVEFQSSFTLENHTLQVLSGNVTVAAGVEATIDSDLSAESANHSIRKLGAGLLRVHGTAGQTVVKAGRLGGTGTFAHLSVRDGGTVEPGDAIGVMNVTNSFNLEEGAGVKFEVGGVLQGSQFDFLDVGGVAKLAGELSVELVGGFEPAIGDQFEILSATGGIEGSFDVETLPTIAGRSWHVLYGTNSVTLAVSLAGDANFDNVVDIRDYVVWRIDPDFTESQYDEWRSNYDAGGSGSGGSVPEPATAILLVAASILVSWRIRRA